MYRYRYGSTSDIFNRTLEQVKSKCTFFDIIEDEGKEYICFNWTGSAFPGKIGFARGDKSDFIETFPDFKFKS